MMQWPRWLRRPTPSPPEAAPQSRAREAELLEHELDWVKRALNTEAAAIMNERGAPPAPAPPAPPKPPKRSQKRRESDRDP